MEALYNILSLSSYEGLIFGLMTIGVYLTFRVLSFPDLSVDGTFPLGGAVAAVIIVRGVNPFLATLAAFGAGMASGFVTGLLNTKLRITALVFTNGNWAGSTGIRSQRANGSWSWF